MFFFCSCEVSPLREEMRFLMLRIRNDAEGAVSGGEMAVMGESCFMSASKKRIHR
jgi:hypothetical protein